MSDRRRKFRDRFTDAVWGQNALRPNERLVALAYAKYAGAKGADEDVSWVEWATLATITGIRSRTTLSKAIQGLVEAGWMDQVEPPRQHRAPRYKLAVPTDPDRRFTYLQKQDSA